MIYSTYIRTKVNKKERQQQGDNLNNTFIAVFLIKATSYYHTHSQEQSGHIQIFP
jgi:hypothetical protein